MSICRPQYSDNDKRIIVDHSERKRRGEHRKVGRDEAQERRGNGADVEKSDERRAQALELPLLIPELKGEGDTLTDTGETGSDHAVGGYTS